MSKIVLVLASVLILTTAADAFAATKVRHPNARVDDAYASGATIYLPSSEESRFDHAKGDIF